MGIITGYISLLCLLMVLAKFVFKRTKLKKADSFLMKSHKYFAFGFLLMSVVHFFLVLSVVKGRTPIIVLSGVGTVIIGIALTIVCHLIKNRRVEIRFHHLFSIIMTVLVVLHVVMYFNDFAAYQQKIDSVQLHEVSLEGISDGDYLGEYDAGYIYARVNVTVKDHRIEKVEILEHLNEKGEKAEVIVDSMVNEQRINVDTVAHATNSSKVIMQACINALERK